MNAARIFGLAEAQTKQADLRRDAVDEAFLARFMTKARSAIGSSTFTACVDTGNSMSFEEAVKLVSAWLQGEQHDPAALAEHVRIV